MNWRRPLTVAWIAVCGAVLVWTLVSCGQLRDPTLRAECSLLAGGIMVFLTLPLGLLWMGLLSAAGHGMAAFGIETGGPSLLSDVIVWFGFAGIGYLQWFKLVPWTLARWRSRRANAPVTRPGACR